MVAAVMPGAAEAGWVARHLKTLAGLGGGQAAGDRSEAFAAWRRFVEALAERRPLVLVFEDLHWADDGLRDFIDYLVEWTGEVPLLARAGGNPLYAEQYVQMRSSHRPPGLCSKPMYTWLRPK
jgi:hypothetical protein